MAEAIKRWKRDLESRHRKRHSVYAEQRPLLAKVYAPFREEVKNRPAVQQAIRSLHALARKRAPRHVKSPISKSTVKPCVLDGSVTSFLAPPYAGTAVGMITYANGGATTNANANDGTYRFNAFGNGGDAAAGAGVYALFNPVSSLPWGHFRPYMLWRGFYSAHCAWEVAHTDGYFHAWVLDFDARGGITVWPPLHADQHLWSIGVSGFDDARSPDEWWEVDQLAGYMQVDFPIIPGHSYGLCTWCEGSCDGAGDHAVSGSSAQAMMSARTPFMAVSEDSLPLGH
jgi:hypothetical protein